jgi:site-specific recombinase XerD
MLLPIKPICNPKKIRKDGTSPIFIQYCLNADQKTLLNTGLGIPPQFWNKKLSRVMDKMPTQWGSHEVLNKEIQRQIRLAQDIIVFALEQKLPDPVHFVKATFTPHYDTAQLQSAAKEMETSKPKINRDFFYQFDEYIHSKEKKVAPATLHVMKNLRLILKTFEAHRGRPITFEEIDLNFYEEYLHYLTYEHIHQNKKEITKGLKTNSLGKNIKQLITFLKNRKQKRIITELDTTGFKIPEEEADAIYLTPEEINGIATLDLSRKPQLEKYRDLFVFGCLTGLRFSDFSVIRPEDVRGGMIYKKQMKTKHWVVIPLRDEAESIFIHRFNRCIPPVSNPEFNAYIKEVGKAAGLVHPVKHSFAKGNKHIVVTRPKYEWITSHTCRRSFCTNEFLAGTPVELIMKISGHKSLKDFYKYIKIAPEQAGQRIREIWEQRGEISKLRSTNLEDS